MLGFPTLIALHSVGMAVAVGLSLMVTLHLNQVFTGFNVQLIPRILSIAVWGFILNLITGLALFVSRGPEYIDSYIFLIKMLLVVISAIILFWLRQHLRLIKLTTEVSVTDRTAKIMSLFSTATWFGAVIAGRLIAYLSDLY
jgi:hypothetical protein